MPQPIRKPCHIEFSGLLHRSQHATMLGIIIGISGRLESVLGWLLAFFSRGSAAITTAMFHATTSSEAQRNMLLAAAELALSGPELDAFNDLMEDFRPRYRERNRLVHNLWGHSNDHLDKAIWCKASDAGEFMAQVAAAASPEQLPFLSTPGLSLRCMTYTVKDLEDAATRLEEYTMRVNNFLNQLMENHPVLAQLASAPPAAQQTNEIPPAIEGQNQTAPE